MKIGIRLNTLLKFGLAMLILISCEEKDPIGKWDDNILLSNNEFKISAKENIIDIKTGGTGWWLIGINVDEEEFIGFENVDVHSPNYSVERGGLTFQRIDEKTIKIHLNSNQKSTSRQFYIHLQNGNYFDTIDIKQAAN